MPLYFIMTEITRLNIPCSPFEVYVSQELRTLDRILYETWQLLLAFGEPTNAKVIYNDREITLLSSDGLTLAYSILSLFYGSDEKKEFYIHWINQTCFLLTKEDYDASVKKQTGSKTH